ncbi:hypothetical protein FRC00_010703 [Tulasnella sp. 408]|nr:hypothetical protein FRC00_010703 [Tulasnella sp. 408]
MWAGKKRGRTTMEVVERPIEEGGFGVPNFALRARTARVMTGKKWCAPDGERPLWADVVSEMIRISSKRVNDPRAVSVLTQTWKEAQTDKGTLPRDVRAMMKELRRYDLRVEALRLSTEAKEETPVWLSKATSLTLKEENSTAMRHLRKQHHVVSMGDLTRVTRVARDGCKKHASCIEAVDLIVRKTRALQNVRFNTPFLEGESAPDGLSFTHRRAEKAKVDAAEGNEVLLDPSLKHKGDLRSALRIFGNPLDPERVPVYRTGPKGSEERTLELWTDGSATDFGTATQKVGFGVWSEETVYRRSSKLTSEPVTNNRAELMAVVVGLSMAPPDRRVIIYTDSQYVVTGLTESTTHWEDSGWFGVTNADAWRKAWHLIRTRTAETSVRKVAAHTGIVGNEEADTLAKAGADGNQEFAPYLEVPHGWQLEGVNVRTLTYGKAYGWIRRRETKAKATASPINVERVLEELLDSHDVRITEAKLWLSLREPYVRREISDFLWLALHGRSQCGTMFSKWGPEWEDLQYCECGAVESMGHILTDCGDAIWRLNLWDTMAELLRSSGTVPSTMCKRPTFGEILALGAIRLPNRVATRLWATVVSETAFVIWKLRNRRRFDGTRISTAMAENLWRGCLEKRAKSDLAVARLKGPKTTTEARRATDAVAVWRGVLSVKGGVVVWNSADYG